MGQPGDCHHPTAEAMPDQWGPGVEGQKPTARITPKWVGREESQQVSLTGEKAGGASISGQVMGLYCR